MMDLVFQIKRSEGRFSNLYQWKIVILIVVQNSKSANDVEDGRPISSDITEYVVAQMKRIDKGQSENFSTSLG